MRIKRDGVEVFFHCPRCQEEHRIGLHKVRWNQDSDNPTISPALKFGDCQFVMTDGKMIFHDGTVDMIHLKEEEVTIPANGKHNADGSISFPFRGDPPVCNVPGFMEDPNDPYRWLMVYGDCVLRKIHFQFRCPRTGKTRTADYCTKLGIAITPRYCNNDCHVCPEERKTGVPLPMI